MTMLFIALLTLLQAQPATVEGTVTKPGGSEPLAGARVTLVALDGASKTALSTATEDDGRFFLSNVSPGSYTLTAESSRYGVTALGQRRPGGPSSTLSIGEGQRLTDIRISMPPTGAIAGRITGRNGEPVVRASVQAYQSIYRDGKRVFVPVQATTANDLGEYRLFWLPAGKYLVAATLGETGAFSPYNTGTAAPGTLRVALESVLEAPILRESFMAGATIRRLLDDGSVQDEAWVPIYYPGTTEAGNATPVDVAAGATMNGVNIVVAPSPVRRISGQVLAPPGTVGRVRLLSVPDFSGLPGLAVTTTGAFEFTGLKPGSYLLLAEDGRNYASAPTPLEVRDRDIEGLRIGVRPKVTLTGRVTFEGVGGETTPGGLGNLVIVLHQRSVELPMATFRPDPNTGTFVVNNVNPGEYRIQIRFVDASPPAPEFRLVQRGQASPVEDTDSRGIFVKSARLGQTDVSNALTITEGSQDRLEIVLTRGTGRLEGVVAEPGRAAAAGSVVVLVPAVARKNSSLYKSTVADSAGRFRFQGVNSGEYLVFAWNDVETGAWQDPGFLRPFESRGVRVQISANSNQEVQVPVISIP